MVTAHFTADANANVCRLPSLDDLLDQTNHTWMRRLIKVRYTVIQAIHCERVLNQIIGPETEEIHLGRDQVRRRSRAWNLDHRADFNAMREDQTRRLKLRAALSHGLFCRDHFINTRHHRNMIPIGPWQDARSKARS